MRRQGKQHTLRKESPRSFLSHGGSPSASLCISGQYTISPQNNSLRSCHDIQGHLRRSRARITVIRSLCMLSLHLISSWSGASKQPLCYVRSLPLHHRIIGRFFGEWGTGAKARGGRKNTAL